MVLQKDKEVFEVTFDAFSAGVEPGGLLSKNDIKILICYLLNSISTPLSEEDIVSVLQEHSLANYFEAVSAVADLKALNNIYSKNNSGLFEVTESGRLIANQLVSSVPISVREKTLNTAVNLLAKKQREKENTVEINKLNNGYSVKCTVSGGTDSELLSFKLYVPDLLQAYQVKKNFQKRPDLIYRIILAGVTMDNGLIKDILKEI